MKKHVFEILIFSMKHSLARCVPATVGTRDPPKPTLGADFVLFRLGPLGASVHVPTVALVHPGSTSLDFLIARVGLSWNVREWCFWRLLVTQGQSGGGRMEGGRLQANSDALPVVPLGLFEAGRLASKSCTAFTKATYSTRHEPRAKSQEPRAKR